MSYYISSAGRRNQVEHCTSSRVALIGNRRPKESKRVERAPCCIYVPFPEGYATPKHITYTKDRSIARERERERERVIA